MKHVSLIGLVILLVAVSLASSVWAAPGDLLGEDQLDKAGESDAAYALAVGAGRIFAGGVVTSNGSCPDLGTGNCDFYVRAYNTGGAVIWEDQVDKAGGPDQLRSLALSQGRLFAAGTVASDGTCSLNTGSGNCDFYVRAYEAATGTLLWEDQLDEAGGADFGWNVAAAGKGVFVTGSITNAAGNFDYLVRAYHGQSGALLWEDQLDKAGSDDGAFAVAVLPPRLVFVGGSTVRSGNEIFLVRAYDAPSGLLLWEDVVDKSEGPDAVWDLAVREGRLFASGVVAADVTCQPSAITGNCDFYVRAYDALSGIVLWEDQVDKAGNADQAFGLAVAGARVFVGGYATNGAGNNDFLIRAYDGATGALLWEDQLDKAGATDYAVALSASADQLFATGIGTTISGYDFLVRAYHIPSGALLWEDQVDLGGGTDYGQDIIARPGVVIVAGLGHNAAGNTDFLVRAYDVQ